MTGHFVFVTNERKPISRSSMSAINSQVAKYSHAHRKRRSKYDGVNNKCHRNHHIDSVNSKAVKLEPKSPLPAKSLTASVVSRPHASPEHAFEIRDDSFKQHEKPDLRMDGTESVTSYQAAIDELPPPHTYPLDVNIDEQVLMHYWFAYVFPDDFDTLLQSAGYMGSLSHYPVAFRVPLRWAVAKATESCCKGRPEGSAKVSLHYRRRALQQLQEVVSDANISTDELLASVIYSIVKDDGNEDMHLKGLDSIIMARGGVDTILKSIQIVQPEHIVHMYTFTPFRIDTYDELLSLKTILLKTITYIQDGILLTGLARECKSPLSDFVPAEQRHPLSETTVIGQHIRLKLEVSETYCWRARQFCVLLLLSLSLLSLESQIYRIDFLKRLEEDANKAASIDLDTGKLRIRADTLVFTVGHVYAQTSESFEGAAVHCRISKITQAAIASLKVFGLLPEKLQLKLFQLLQHGLLQLDGNTQEPATTCEGCCDSWDDFQKFTVSQEIDRVWIEERTLSLKESTICGTEKLSEK